MNETVEELGRWVFNSVGKRVPNRLKWEFMGLFPSPYLNIADATTETALLESGQKEVADLIDNLAAYDEDFDVDGADILEIGTGPGRMLIPFSDRAGLVSGVDVSWKNIRDARKLADEHDVDVELKRSERGLPEFEMGFDLVYSLFVFQHMRRRYAISYILDTHEQLRPGGIVYFSFANLEDEENLKTLFTEGLDLTYSFRMRYHTESEVRTYLKRVGFEDIEVLDKGHQLVAMARKPA